jgi:clan AA aspartic protease
MGLSYASLTLKNPRYPELESLQVEALADTGAIMLCVPQHVALQLKLETMEQREVTTADGKKHLVDYVGPLQISFGKRTSFGGALVLGDSVLLGAIQMEDMDLVVIPREQRVAVNPESPNIPTAIVK